MAPKRAPPRRPPTKQPMNSVKQVHYLNQQQAQMTRMFQQQARDRRTQIVRSVVLFILLVLIATYTYRSYGLVVMIAVVVAGWMMGFLEVVQLAIAWVVRNAAQPSYDELLRRADILSHPIKTKETVSGENEYLAYGCSSMQGWRRSMEDAHTLLTLDKGGFFGVYDGHSGAATSKYCGEYMFQFVHQTPAFMRGEFSQALYDGFIALDKYLHSLPSFERGGCAAVVLYVDADVLYCANAGDSRCIMCRNGSVDALSNDHKPFLPGEQMRIERAGCYVLNRRVNGMLALSRAIGDFMFKNNSQVTWEMQAVTCAPEVRMTRLNRDKDEFAVLACDGIWDMMTSEQVVEFVRPRIQQRVPLGRICEELMDACLSPQPFGLGCDNMSVIIVTFKRGPQGVQVSGSGSTGSASGNFTAAGGASVQGDEHVSGKADGAAGEGKGSGSHDHGSPTSATPSAAERDGTHDDNTNEAGRALPARPLSPPAQSPNAKTSASVPMGNATSPETVPLSSGNAHNGAAQHTGGGGGNEKDGSYAAAGRGNVMRPSTSSPPRSGASSPDASADRSAKRKSS